MIGNRWNIDSGKRTRRGWCSSSSSGSIDVAVAVAVDASMIDFVTAIRSRRNGGVDVPVIPAITGIGIDIDIDIIDCRTVALSLIRLLWLMGLLLLLLLLSSSFLLSPDNE
jgi:hypothetical protein